MTIHMTTTTSRVSRAETPTGLASRWCESSLAVVGGRRPLRFSRRNSRECCRYAVRSGHGKVLMAGAVWRPTSGFESPVRGPKSRPPFRVRARDQRIVRRWRRASLDGARVWEREVWPPPHNRRESGFQAGCGFCSWFWILDWLLSSSCLCLVSLILDLLGLVICSLFLVLALAPLVSLIAWSSGRPGRPATRISMPTPRRPGLPRLSSDRPATRTTRSPSP